VHPVKVGSDGELRLFLQQRVASATQEVARLDADYLLTENEDVLVAAIISKFMPEPVTIAWANPSRSAISETSLQVRDAFDRGTFTVPASRVVISYPIEGTAELLHYQANRGYMQLFDADINGASLDVEVVARELTADAVSARTREIQEHVGNMAEWANSDLRTERERLESGLRGTIAARKARLLADRQLEAALGIPMKRRGTVPPAVPAVRRAISIETRSRQKPFVPEPVLEEAHYKEVLRQVETWAASLERVPGTAAKLDEEELRDHLLVGLNLHWEGRAGGELFNGAGKTDILIREGDRNVFIAECKFWRGPKSATTALTQLLSYLVWRDSKAALIVFVTTKDPAASIASLHATIEADDRFLLKKPGGAPERRGDYVIRADDEGRTVSVAVMPVVIRPAA
jgi:hypothetical protein